MNYVTIKKLLILSCAICAAGFADQTTDENSVPYTIQQPGLPEGYNAPASIDVKGKWDFFTSAQFIYWQPSETYLSPAWKPSVGFINPNTFVEMDFKFHPGFKAGAGMIFPRDDWSLYAEYTWMRIHDQVTGEQIFVQNVSDNLYPSWLVFDHWGRTQFEKAVGNWHHNTNIIDLQLARSMYAGTALSLKPYLGLRGTIMPQRYQVDYHYRAALHPFPVILKAKQKTWAIGPKLGIDIQYMFGNFYKLTGGAFFALLQQHHRMHMNQRSDQGVTTYYNMKDKYNNFSGNPGLYLGLGTGMYIYNGNAHVDVTATYDFQVFYNYNMMRNFYGHEFAAINHARIIIDYGSLYYQGLTLAARVDF